MERISLAPLHTNNKSPDHELKTYAELWAQTPPTNLRRQISPEEKKFAIRHDPLTAFYAGLIHLLPITATIVLVYLNWRGYYIYQTSFGQDDAQCIALQFAAKLHDLTMTASLAAVIFSYIRHELTTSKGLPFGAKLVGLSFKDISYPWSMESWGATRTKCRRRRDNAALVLLVITCAGLAVSAGPARATLMRPRLDDWPAGGTDFWIALPQDDLFSTKVMSSEVPISCMSDTGDSSRPSAGWETIVEDYIAPWQQVQAFGYLPDTFRSQV